MKTSAMIVLLACVTAAGFIGWRVHATANYTANYFAVLEDPSTSYTGGCESAVGSAEQLLREPAVSPTSKIILLALGDNTTANEPRELGKYNIPTRRKVIEGRHAQERRQLELLQDIGTQCASIRPTSISPIFMGVKQALADLRGEGCKRGSQCELRVNSDLEENVEPGIRNRLNSPGGNKHPLPGTLDNAGIDVSFCGLAATAGRNVNSSSREVQKIARRDPNREDRMQQTWLSVFTNPERVKFEPYCPKPSDPNLYTTATELSRRFEKRR